MKNYTRSIILAFLAVGIAGIAAVWYAHGYPVPVFETFGAIASKERSLIIFTLALSLVVVVPVFVMLIVFVLRYRADNLETEKHHLPSWDHSHFSELIWWVIPITLIAILGVVAWRSSNALDPFKPIKSDVPALSVQVISLDWKWLFIYPDQDIATVNYLEIPVGTPVHLYLTSDAPMNSFWVPALSGQIMTMPGMVTQLNIIADASGTYRGVSGNLSGTGFSGMSFSVRAVPAADFAQWSASSALQGDPLSREAYERLAAPSSYLAPFTYAPVTDTNLFEGVVMKYMMPGTDMNTDSGNGTPGAASTGTMDMHGMRMASHP